MNNAKIKERKPLHQGYLTVESLTIEENGQTYEREFVNKNESVVVLVLNTDMNDGNGALILTKQYRPVGEYVIEAVAGNIENGEGQIETAIREVEEEVGYRITEENLQFVSSGYVSSGFTNEKYHKYVAFVTNDMKVSNGGGVAAESEVIEVLEMDVDQFVRVGDDQMDDKTQSLRYVLGFLIMQKNMEEMQQLMSMMQNAPLMDLENMEFPQYDHDEFIGEGGKNTEE